VGYVGQPSFIPSDAGLTRDTSKLENTREVNMATAKQKQAARRNIKKAAKAAKKKRTIAHLPKRTRTALGKEAAKVTKKGR
jgi:hypothetical protein